MEIKQEIERISKLQEKDIGPTEENVKQKIIVPILELLGHKRENLEFEYRTRRGGKIDIFIKNVPPDCKVLIDTKNYTENLNDHVEQIKEYTFDESTLLTVIANGTEIRIYSPLRGVAFERSLLYSIKRQELNKESVWKILSDLLQNDNLQNRNVLKKIEERERKIKDAMTNEERLKQEYDSKIEGIDSDIETKEEEIEQLKKEKEILAKKAETDISEIWNDIALPFDFFRISTRPGPIGITQPVYPPEYVGKAGRVTLQELVDAGLVKDGQTLYFYNTRLFRDEQAQIIASSNKLKYKTDDKIYSISELAKVLLKKHNFKRDEHGVAGPKYWRTEDGRLLNDLNERVRAQRGDRK
jgi:predicted type IV restriction endonuclease